VDDAVCHDIWCEFECERAIEVAVVIVDRINWYYYHRSLADSYATRVLRLGSKRWPKLSHSPPRSLCVSLQYLLYFQVTMDELEQSVLLNVMASTLHSKMVIYILSGISVATQNIN